MISIRTLDDIARHALRSARYLIEEGHQLVPVALISHGFDDVRPLLLPFKNEEEKTALISVLRSFLKKETGVRLVAFVSEGWEVTVSAQGPLPTGAVKDLPGAVETVVVVGQERGGETFSWNAPLITRPGGGRTIDDETVVPFPLLAGLTADLLGPPVGRSVH